MQLIFNSLKFSFKLFNFKINLFTKQIFFLVIPSHDYMELKPISSQKWKSHLV